VFYEVKKVRQTCSDRSDDIRPDRPPEIGIDAVQDRKIEMHRQTTARTLALLLNIFPQRINHHLHHDLEMKRDDLTGVSKS
jgi:hypothetical protein